MIGQVNKLYNHVCEDCGGIVEDLGHFENLADLDPIYLQIAKDLMAKKDVKINADLHLETAKKLNEAIKVKTEVGKGAKLEPYLKRNVYHFSAAKNFVQMEYFRDGMVDKKGNIKSFDSFKKWVANSGEMFNERHLRVEYDMAHSSALMAKAWDDLDSDLVEFSTAGDSNVRPSHAKLDKFTAPKNDPIWKRICPPLAWGCRCKITAGNKNTPRKMTNTEAYNTVKDEVKGTVFENNSAVSKIIFNNDHPYFKDANGREKQLSWSNYGMNPISKIKTNELDVFQNREIGANDTIKTPHESWMNPDKGTTKHVRYYQDKAVIVTTGKDNEILSTNVISIDREKAINNHRKGVLMHKE